MEIQLCCFSRLQDSFLSTLNFSSDVNRHYKAFLSIRGRPETFILSRIPVSASGSKKSEIFDGWGWGEVTQ